MEKFLVDRIDRTVDNYRLAKEYLKNDSDILNHFASLVFSHYEKEITVDAYSLTNNLNLVSESFKYTKSIQSISENKTIDCELLLQDDQKRISKILFVCGENVNVTNAYIQDENGTIWCK